MSRAVARLLLVWAGLLALLALTFAVAHLPIGTAKTFFGYGIAAAKAALILWFFMEMRREGGIARLASLAAFAWLAMMTTLVAADYLTRGAAWN